MHWDNRPFRHSARLLCSSVGSSARTEVAEEGSGKKSLLRAHVAAAPGPSTAQNRRSFGLTLVRQSVSERLAEECHRGKQEKGLDEELFYVNIDLIHDHTTPAKLRNTVHPNTTTRTATVFTPLNQRDQECCFISRGMTGSCATKTIYFTQVSPYFGLT